MMNSSLQNRIQEFEITPPEGSWEMIRTEISGGKVVNLNSSHFSVTSIAAALVLFVMASIFFRIHPEAVRVSNANYTIIRATIDTAETTKYITLQGPQGQLKVSPKVAAIFVAPETPSKAQWNKKLSHWKDIMMTASNTDFMDVIGITESAEMEN